MIITGENGVLINKENDTEIADGIMWILEDKDRYEYMRNRAVEIFNERYTSLIYTRNIEKVYESEVGLIG